MPMTTRLIEIVSGNVPGGIGLYLLLMLTVLFILFYIYRTSEFFTRVYFHRWLLGTWLFLTSGYLILWFMNPPPTLLKRYSVFFTASQPEHRWIAYYYRDEISKMIKPFQGSSKYFFPQRWIYYANLEDSLETIATYEKIARKIPIHEVVIGRIGEKNKELEIQLVYKKFPSGKTIDQYRITLPYSLLHTGLEEVLKWIRPRFPVLRETELPVAENKTFILARDAFFRRIYRESAEQFKRLLQKYPQSLEIKKWYYFSRIKSAAYLRTQEKWRNPFDPQKSEWQVILEEARANLLRGMRDELEAAQKDDFLNNLIGESYLMEEAFEEAEIFLKNAYLENPFNIEVLENLASLHRSRYQKLGFSDEGEILERILNLCPLHENVLIRYVNKMLRRGPVRGVPFLKARDYIDAYLEMHPTSADAWLLLGKYYEQSADSRGSLQAFQKADSLNPNSALIKYNLGVINYRLGKVNLAEKYFLEAIRKNDYLDAHLYLGVIYKNQGFYRKALKEFRYRVKHKRGEDDFYAVQAMKGIRECLKAVNISIPE